jgi:fucose 4-O-acetylase-like acetyltransferase
MDNPVQIFVYLFHMPLFFMISGMFFNSSLKLGYKELIKRKSIRLLLPYILWTFLHILATHQNPESLLDVIGIVTVLWFLPGLFVIYLLVYFSYKTLKHFYLIVVFYIVYIIIGGPWGQFIPAFLIGIFLRNRYTFILKYRNKLLLIFAVLFGICLFFWKGNYWFYNFKIISLTRLELAIPNVIGLYHMFIGIAGSLFFFFLFQIAYRKNKLCLSLREFGKCTLEIYLLHGYIILLIRYFLIRIIEWTNIWTYSLLFAPIIAILIFLICMSLIKIVYKNKYIGLILFGKIKK